VKLRARVGARVFDLEVEPSREERSVLVRLEGTEHRVDLERVEGDTWSLLVGTTSHELSLLEEREGTRVRCGGAEALVRLQDPGRDEIDLAGEDGALKEVTAIMPGRVARVLVEPGQEVARSQGLLVVEAMKMENEIASPRAATVRRVRVAAGQHVETGAVLVELE
jgi:biotin carboxyl carrier protein